MFQFLQVKSSPTKLAPDPESVSLRQLLGDSALPISMHALLGLPEATRQRLYRILMPPGLLALFNISPITWKDREGNRPVRVLEKTNPGLVNLSITLETAPEDPLFCIELSDNALNGIDLNLLQLCDPGAPRYGTDRSEDGEPTLFGTVRRNLVEEARAMQAGLSPGQTRAGLRASAEVFNQLEAFLALLAHESLFLEPLTYTSACLFERRGFAYIRGHKLMQDIDREFQPGGALHSALDGSSPFRQPEQHATVRGRAWAIHDGILEAIGERWNDLRMVKRLGRYAVIQTFKQAIF
jgi:hypothetical protein